MCLYERKCFREREEGVRETAGVGKEKEKKCECVLCVCV